MKRQVKIPVKTLSNMARGRAPRQPGGGGEGGGGGGGEREEGEKEREALKPLAEHQIPS